MIRDFSEKSKQEIIALTQQVAEENWCGLTDWLGDRWLDFQSWIGVLNIQHYSDNIQLYHKKVIDKNNATKAEIERIFADVYRVDSQYNIKIRRIIDTIQAFRQLVLELGAIITPGNSQFTPEQIRPLLEIRFKAYRNLLVKAAIGDALLASILEELRIKGEVTEEDKNRFIKLYETYHAEETKALDNFLSKLSEEEIREVKYYIYTAPEPYRSIYLENYEKYTIGNVAGKDTGYFSPYFNTVNVDMPAEPGNPRGPFVTFFHESGHAIDYHFQNDGTYYSMTYRNKDGKSLQDMIKLDVTNNVKDVIAQKTTDKVIQDHLLDYIMGADPSKLKDLTAQEKTVLSSIQSQYKSDIDGAVNEAPSDIYGGITNNIISGGYGHWKSTYWYQDGSPTYAQSRELWAEYYSYCATGDTDNLEALTKYFPNAREFLDEMAASMN